MMVSFNVNGREIKFPKSELIYKLNKLEALENSVVKERDLIVNHKFASKPTDNMCFKVNLETINEALFKKKRYDFLQEWTRKAIIMALDEAKKEPKKYGKTFATFVPSKTWHSKTVEELMNLANVENGNIADWVIQALVWAQRISNGEPWERICNKPDTLTWYRIILWKNKYAKIVGGSRFCNDNLPSIAVFGNHIELNAILQFTVPLITIYL